MADAGEQHPESTPSDEDVGPAVGDSADPITAALLAAVQARRRGDTDAAVLTALQRAADYCTQRLRQRLDQAITDAYTAQQHFQAARAGTDKAEALRLFHAADAATRHAQIVGLQVDEALQDLALGATELAAPALERMQRAIQATQRLADEADYRQ